MTVKSKKRNWVESKIDCRLVVWNTDLEQEEQNCVNHMLEYCNYEKNSFELEDLEAILARNLENKKILDACDMLIKALKKRGKEIIEIE